jgi:hypothetical protein
MNVKLGDFGTLRLSLSSEGADNPEVVCLSVEKR